MEGSPPTGQDMGIGLPKAWDMRDLLAASDSSFILHPVLDAHCHCTVRQKS